jgi:ribose transport system substrate-binding protein
MMLSRSRFSALLLAAALAGCMEDAAPPASSSTPPPGGEPSAGRGRVIGVSLLTKTHPFYKDLEGGLQEAAGRLGCVLKVQSAEFDTATQTSQVENFVTQRVDAIVVCPVDSEAIGGAIKRANEARIPVFTADIRSMQGDIVCHIASDNVQGGFLIGDYLASKALKGKGKVAVLDHPVVTSVQDRVKGFEDALKKHPDIKIVAKLPAGGVRDQAATTMENILQAHPDLNAVFGINDNSALGAISVLQARGRKDVIVVGFDADPEGREAIRKGDLLADAIQYPGKIGRTTIETVIKHLQGQTVPKEIPIETGVLDKAGLEKP